MKFKLLFEQKYRKQSYFVKEDLLPDLKHSNGYAATHMEILSTGHCELDGRQLEFQNIRIYLDTQK
jgi:hypothetical protein